MLEQICINSTKEYNYAIKRGYKPLLDLRFYIEPELRRNIQKELFGAPAGAKNKIPKANDRFYHYMWNNSVHICQETGLPLHEYSAIHISHILTKQAYPEIAHDPRNVNILSADAHNQWEFGMREKMLIYGHNLRIIKILKRDYELWI